MTVVFQRIVTPHSGHLDDSLQFAKERRDALQKAFDIEIALNTRFGGPAGQISMVSYHDNMGELEALRRKVIEGVAAGTIPQPKPGMIEKVEDAIWIRL